MSLAAFAAPIALKGSLLQLSTQNGVSERKVRTIMIMARNLLSEKGVPKQFWPEV